jgi:hypothetical protein
MVAFPKLDHVKWPYLGNLTLATAIAPVIGINDLCFAVSATPASNQANYSSSSNPTTNFLVSADTPAGGTSNGLTIAGVQATDANVNAPLFAGVAKERQTAGSLASSSEVVPEWVGDIACVSASFKIGDSVTVVLNSATTADSNGISGSANTYLQPQTVIKTTASNQAIGYVLVDTLGASVTTIRVRLLSRLTKGSATGAGTTAIGYTSGAGGAVTQITTITTGVTLSKLTGQITTVASTLAALTTAQFTVTNTLVAATDIIALSTTYAGAGSPVLQATAMAAGSFVIVIDNAHASAALNAALVINFAVIKGAIA